MFDFAFSIVYPGMRGQYADFVFWHNKIQNGNLKDNPPVPVVPVTATAKKPGKKSNRPIGDKTMRIPNELVPLMQTAIDRLYNNPASGTVDLNEIQKFINEAGKLL